MASKTQPYSADHLALGRAIIHFRRELGLSQEALAAKIGLDRSYMGSIETGKRNFSVAKLLLIAGGLEIPPSELIAEYERRLAGGE